MKDTWTLEKIKNVVLETLRAEVRPAIGCTEPVAIALAVAKAREASELELSEIEHIRVNIGENVFKNAMGVGIPGTKRFGIDMAIALGAVCGKSEQGLKIFENVGPDCEKRALKLIDRGIIDAAPVESDNAVFVEAHVEGTDERWGVAIVAKRHDRFVHVENHDGIEHEEEVMPDTASASPLEGLTIAQLVNAVESIPYEDIAFMKDGAEMNLAIARYGLENASGLKVGSTINEDEDFIDCGHKKAMMLTAAAADARMSGANIPVMSSNGSGNNGLTTIIPVAVYCEEKGVDDEKMCRAIAISHLTNSVIKSKIGRLSALCGCSTSAGSGAAAALTWLRGGGEKEIYAAIQNMIANTSGMICDGAKGSCALKLATSVAAANLSASLAMSGVSVGCGNGIIGLTADDSIDNLGEFATKTHAPMDKAMLRIMRKNTGEE